MRLTPPTRRPLPRRVAAVGRPRIVAIGDSYVRQHHGTGYQSFTGPINIANAVLGQPYSFTQADNLGTGGQKSAEILDRLPVALEARPDLLVICAGSNDIRSSIAPRATLDALSAMAGAVDTAGIETLFLTMPPRGAEQWPRPEQVDHALAINQHLAVLADQVPRVAMCDWVADNVAPGGDYRVKPGHTHDGTHFSAIGAYRAGVRLAQWWCGSGCPAPATAPGGPLHGMLRGSAGLLFRLRRTGGDATATLSDSMIAIGPGAVDSGFMFETDPPVLPPVDGAPFVSATARVTLEPSDRWSYAFLELIESGVEDGRRIALYPASQVRPLPVGERMTMQMLTDPLPLTGGAGLRVRIRIGVRRGGDRVAMARIDQVAVGQS